MFCTPGAFLGLLLAVTVLVLQLVIFVVMPNRAARTLAALFASIAWMYCIRFVLRPGDVEDLFFGGRHRDMPLGAATLPLGWLLTWAPLVIGAIVADPPRAAAG